jgi:hypothetical protein
MAPVYAGAAHRCCRVTAVEQHGAIKALVGLRLAVGVSSWATPRLAGRSFGIDAAANPQIPYVSRLFGVRDAALAIGVLTSDGDARRHWLTVGLACDAADVIAGVAGGRRGYLSKRTAALVTAAAVSAVVLGARALDGR